MSATNEEAGYVTVPIGGVHRDIVMGNKTDKGGFGKVMTESIGVVAGPAFTLPKSWKYQVEEPWTLRQVETRELSGGDERVVGRYVNKRWWVGARDLRRKDIEKILEDRGLDFVEDLPFGEKGPVPYTVSIWRPKGTAARD